MGGGLIDWDFRKALQSVSEALVNLEGMKRVSEERIPEGAGEPNPLALGTSSRSACCPEYSYESSATSNSGARLEAATHSARQKISDNSIQAPRITNNNVVILSILISSQRAAPKTSAILGKCGKVLANSETASVSIRYVVVPFMGFAEDRESATAEDFPRL